MNRASSASGPGSAIAFLPRLHPIEVFAQAIEPCVQPRQLLVHPSPRLAEPLLFQAVDPGLGMLAIGDQSALAQHLEVARNRGPGDLEPAGDVARVALAGGQHADDFTPGRICEGLENVHTSYIAELLNSVQAKYRVAGGAAAEISARTSHLESQMTWIVAMSPIKTVTLAGLLSATLSAASTAQTPSTTPAVAVGPQYDTTHVYVAEADMAAFATSFIATFGGHASAPATMTVTPTPSSTRFEAVQTPAGSLSVFGFRTPIPYVFGAERTGYLVTDMDVAIAAARATGAAVLVTPFPDPIGRDAVIEWPGGVDMQLYWHTTPPSYAPLATIPENRVYLSKEAADEFVRDFLAFAHGAVTQDDVAQGVEIGRPGETYRRIRISSGFGKAVVLVTDGHLPWPYGREVTGYEVADLTATLAKATAAGVKILVTPYQADRRVAAIVEFPGGYIAEIHAAADP
jgi:hypothetical protein